MQARPEAELHFHRRDAVHFVDRQRGPRMHDLAGAADQLDDCARPIQPAVHRAGRRAEILPSAPVSTTEHNLAAPRTQTFTTDSDAGKELGEPDLCGISSGA